MIYKNGHRHRRVSLPGDLNTGWKGPLGSPCPDSTPAGTTAHSFFTFHVFLKCCQRTVWSLNAESLFSSAYMSVDRCTTYCAFPPCSAVSFILKTELDSKTIFFFGSHLNYLSYPLKSCPIFPSPSLLCLWKSFFMFILTSGKGNFWVLASVGHMGRGKLIKCLMSLLFPIVLIKGRRVQRNFSLILFRDGYEIISGREEFMVVSAAE